MSQGPKYGVTVRAHVQDLLFDAQLSLEKALKVMEQGPRRIRPAQREAMRRELAGVIADCETVRVWLDKGAPNVTFKGTD